MTVDVADAVRRIGGLTIIRRMRGGEGVGAWEVEVTDGRRAVLKIDDGPHLDFERAARTCDALRARGYPAPRSFRTGAIDDARFGINELLPGTQLDAVGIVHVARVVELVDLQRDLGLPGRRPWIDEMVTSVTEGRVGYCEHGAMTAHSTETRALLDRVRRVAGETRDLDVATDDVVHTDFCNANMLVDGDSITGIVDWEGSTSGDAAFDLVTQALYAHEVRDALLESARSRTDPRALHLYAAHMVLRQVDWSLRHHGAAEARWYIDAGVSLLEAVGAG
jgi:aminoglycoside phosphotransferase